MYLRFSGMRVISLLFIEEILHFGCGSINVVSEDIVHSPDQRRLLLNPAAFILILWDMVSNSEHFAAALLKLPERRLKRNLKIVELIEIPGFGTNRASNIHLFSPLNRVIRNDRKCSLRALAMCPRESP